MKFVKKKIISNGTLISLSYAVSPSILFLNCPGPLAGVRLPRYYLTDMRKNTGKPYVSISQNSL